MRVVSSHPVASGIKQGYPLLGTLLALTLDPLIRHYLLVTTLCCFVICPFADDLGLVTLKLFVQIPIILDMFYVVGPCDRAEAQRAQTCPDSSLSLLPGHRTMGNCFGGDRWGLCIRLWQIFGGVEVGPGAHQHQWTFVLHKMASRIGELGVGGKSVPARVFMFNTYVASPFAYKAQFAPISTEAHTSYRDATPLSTKAPWQAMPSEIRTELSFLGLSSGIRRKP